MKRIHCFFIALFMVGTISGGLHAATAANLYDLAVHDGTLYAVGQSKTILRSNPDGLWEVVDDGPDRETWEGVAAGDGKLVAVARDGGIAVSGDGQTWQAVEGGSGMSLARVIHAAGQFWAIGNAGRLIRSADGSVWETTPTGVAANLWGIVYAEGLFVIVGEQGTILTSQGGESWTAQAAVASWNIRDVVFGDDGFVAIARGGLVLRSSDGVSWSASPEPLSTGLLSAVAFGNGRYVAAGGIGPGLAAFVSEDAETWQRVEIPLPAHVSRLIFDGERFVGAGYGGSILASADGEDWEVLTTGIELGLWGVTEASAGNLIAVGEGGRIQKSTTGGPWETVFPRHSGWLWGIASGNGWTIAVGEGGTILRTVNGSDWEAVANPASGARLGGVTFGQGIFVAVGEGGTVLVSSDGSEWTLGELPVPSMFWSVAHGGGKFVAAGEGGTAAVSSDGWNWEALPFDEAHSLHAVAFHPGHGFSISGADAFLAHSADGSAWEVLPALSHESWGGSINRVPFESRPSWEGAASGTGWLVAVGERGAIAISAEGQQWNLLDPGDGESLYDLVVGDGGVTAVGASGRVRNFPLPGLAMQHSGDVTTAADGTVILSAIAGGTGPFTYRWIHDGLVLPGEEEPSLHLTGIGRDAIGEYTLELTNAAGTAESAPFFVTVLTDYETWATARFADPEGASASPDADPTGEGVPNLLAYAFESDPSSVRGLLPVAHVARLAEDEGEADYLTLTFARSIGATDVLYIPEASEDLVNWSPVGAESVIGISREGSRELVTVRDPVELSESSRHRFMRLRVRFVE